MIESLTIGNIICALISAKWAMELGYSQIRQLLCFLAGIIFGPIALLTLYAYLVRKSAEERRTNAKFI